MRTVGFLLVLYRLKGEKSALYILTKFKTCFWQKLQIMFNDIDSSYVKCYN